MVGRRGVTTGGGADFGAAAPGVVALGAAHLIDITACFERHTRPISSLWSSGVEHSELSREHLVA
jgi:hypothetical protein